jgi:hypothetical protein
MNEARNVEKNGGDFATDIAHRGVQASYEAEGT